MAKIEIKPVITGIDKKAFINIQWTIYKNDPYWVPQLKMAIKDILNPKHPFYETAETQMFLAKKDHAVVGRIMAIHPKKYNEFHNSNVGFYGFYECIKDSEVGEQLLKKAESWCRDRGLSQIMGPFNPSSNYESGLLVKGFDDPPQVMMTYNPSYYIKHMENYGYVKEMDLLAYRVKFPFQMNETIVKISDRAEKRNKITYRKIDKSDFDNEVQRLLEIYNDAWENNWGFVPYTEKEFLHMAKDLKMIVDEKLLLFVEVDGETAGFIACLPDMNQVFKTIPNGCLFPTGIFKLLSFKKRVNRVRVPLMGVKQKFRKLGIETLLYYKAQLACQENGYKECEASWILEDNIMMNRPLKKMGFDAYKAYRIYKKDL